MAYSIATYNGIKQHFSPFLYKATEPFFKLMVEGEFFCDDKPVNKSSRHVVKISVNNFNRIKPLLSKVGVKVGQVGGKRASDVDFGQHEIRFLETGKTSVSASDGASTAKQERASLLIIVRALKDKKNYQSANDIAKDKPFYKALLEVYPEVNDVWLKGLFAQYKKMKQEFSGSKFSEFNRDGGFMDFISKLIKDEFNIPKKDSWNPADVWLINEENKVRADLIKAAKGGSIDRLNDVMRDMLKKKRLVGVSLKAVSGTGARLEYVNTKVAIGKTDIYKLSNIRMNFSLSGSNLSTTDTVITVKNKEGEAKFQLRQNSKGFNNLKFEPTMKGQGAARLGKVPLNLLGDMLVKDYNITKKKFVNNWRLYPLDSAMFSNRESEFKSKFSFVASKVDTGISTSNFISSVKTSFNGSDKRNGYTTSKLQQLDFVYSIMKLSEKERNELMTRMLYLAMKKGPSFGPFVKLY